MTAMSDAVLEPPRRAGGAGSRAAIVRWTPPLIAAAMLALLIVADGRELHTYHLYAILRDLASLSSGRVLAALALTIVGRLVHVGYGLLALRYAQTHAQAGTPESPPGAGLARSAYTRRTVSPVWWPSSWAMVCTLSGRPHQRR